MDRTDSGNSLHHGLPFLSFVGLAWLQACSEQPGEAPGSPSWEGAKGPQAEPAESWGHWEEPRGVAPPACTRQPVFPGSGGWKRGRLTGPTPWQPARCGSSSRQRSWSGLGPQTGLGAGVWLHLCWLVLRDQGQALSVGTDTGAACGQGNNTFLSHRQVGVAAGFAGPHCLLEQGPLEIWQLREGEKHWSVKISYTSGAVLQVTGARAF